MSNNRLEALYEIGKVIGTGVDIERVFVLIMGKLSQIMGAKRCSLMLIDEASNELVIKAAQGLGKRIIEKTRVKIGEGISGWMAEYGAPLLIANIERDPRFKRRSGEGYFSKSLLSVPLKIDDKVIGVLNINEKRNGGIFNKDELRLLSLFANQIAIALENARLARQVKEKRKIDTMLKSMGEGIIMVDNKNRLLLLNPAAKRLLKFKERQGVTNEDLLKRFQDIGIAELLKEVAEKGGAVTKEVRLKGSEEMTISAEVIAVKDRKGKRIGLVIALRDITKIKKLDRERSDFISTVNHELRTPLTSVKEAVSLILDGATGRINETQARFLTLARRNIDRLVLLVNNLLDISRLEAGKMELEMALLNIAKVAKKAIADIKSPALKKKIVLKSSLPSHLSKVRGDFNALTTVFTNLLSNAVKATSERGRIRVEVKEAGDSIRVSVSDTGIGIHKADLDKVFDKFYQVSGALTLKEKGSGLGLAITKGIIEAHKGRIWVESEVEKGSKFIFTLPRIEKEYKRKEFSQSLVEEIKKARRRRATLSLLRLKINNLQEINATYGSRQGARIKNEVERIAKETLRPEDIVTRYREEEFAILLPGTDRERALMAGERLKAAIERYGFDTAVGPLRATVSLGLASYPKDSKEKRQLIEMARPEKLGRRAPTSKELGSGVSASLRKVGK